MNTLKRIYDTKYYIASNYSRPIAIQKLENISCYSYRNLQRIFISLFNENIGSYQTRLKVENGYKKLLYTKAPISDIAFELGFSDLQSFSKTFKKNFGITPTKARKQKENLLTDADDIQIVPQELKPETVSILATEVYYQSKRTYYQNPDIEALWDEFLEHNFDENTDFYGLISDDIVITHQGKCSYDACANTNQTIKNLPFKKIFGGQYLRFTHQGNYNSIEETYKQIYGGWILENDIQFSHTPIIEHYIKHQGNCASEEEYITHILIPLL
jgi:AraC family transcriptional regulator